MQKSALKFTMLLFLLAVANSKHLRAQQVYGDDFVTMAKCRDYTCISSMAKEAKFSYNESYSTKGVNETYQCDVPNEDGSKDMINFQIYKEVPNPYNEVIFATDRYHTYDALKNGLLFHAFRQDSTGKSENGATITFYYSPMHKDMAMITQVFDQSPEGPIAQFYITLHLFRKE